MKKIKLSFVLFSFLIFGSMHAQKVEITPQFGYQVGAKYNYYGGYVKLKSSEQYGLTFGINATDDITVEFMWAQQNSKVSIKDFQFYPQETELTDVVVNHYQIGGIHMFGYSDARPFAGLSAGWSTFNPEDNRYDGTTTFTLGLTGGLKYFFTDRIGLRLQAQLLMPVSWGGVYIGGGGGGVTTGGSILQLNFSGGLIIGLGD
ncbi:outer membrane beta-barrel protein [Lutimonas zeaxanthinifaciens]|uniref:outer membrane beta-barrel protein n=1 Tax=Lutimonas zeaxanthinifaciens TaxID=3060215 RepID=UPI00265D1AA5|nr:outer membrane beta-barrel protein [Lutimonas sp. YSD2104]WKK64643.1 hypothetical protein QZH61_08570 [Lutimonas sp. YSD2104]